MVCFLSWKNTQIFELNPQVNDFSERFLQFVSQPEYFPSGSHLLLQGKVKFTPTTSAGCSTRPEHRHIFTQSHVLTDPGEKTLFIWNRYSIAAGCWHSSDLLHEVNIQAFDVGNRLWRWPTEACTLSSWEQKKKVLPVAQNATPHSMS